MGSQDLQSLFSGAALAALRADPAFEAAARELALGSLAEFESADAAGRWMFRDLGRSSLYLASVVLDAGPDGLTASALATAARIGQLASRGRVMAFLRRAQLAGDILAPAEAGRWTRSRLALSPRFVERLRAGAAANLRAAGRLYPAAGDMARSLRDGPFFRRYVLRLAAAGQAAGLTGYGAGGAERLFLERDCGGLILMRLMLSQPSPTARLLQAAPLSRSRLAAEFGVSRVHINRLLAEATARGLLICPAPGQVVFSEALSEDFGRMMAEALLLARTAWLGARADMAA